MLLCHKFPRELKARGLGLEGARGYRGVLAGKETHRHKRDGHIKQLWVIKSQWCSECIAFHDKVSATSVGRNASPLSPPGCLSSALKGW